MDGHDLCTASSNRSITLGKKADIKGLIILVEELLVKNGLSSLLLDELQEIKFL